MFKFYVMLLSDIRFNNSFPQNTGGRGRKLAVTGLIIDCSDEELNMQDVQRVVKVCPAINTLTIDSPESIHENLAFFVGVRILFSVELLLHIIISHSCNHCFS